MGIVSKCSSIILYYKLKIDQERSFIKSESWFFFWVGGCLMGEGGGFLRSRFKLVAFFLTAMLADVVLGIAFYFLFMPGTPVGPRGVTGLA